MNFHLDFVLFLTSSTRPEKIGLITWNWRGMLQNCNLYIIEREVEANKLSLLNMSSNNCDPSALVRNYICNGLLFKTVIESWQ